MSDRYISINGNGGREADFSDGIAAFVQVVLPYVDDEPTFGHSDDIRAGGTRQWCCSGSSPMLNIGGTLFGTGGAATYPEAQWDSVELISASGTAQEGPDFSSTLGSGSATIRYTATVDDLVYQMDRTLSYVYPNLSIREDYAFTIPTGNTKIVKFYLGGDAAPGSRDLGLGMLITSPVRTVLSVNPESGIQSGFSEIAGSTPFDHYYIGHYWTPYDAVRAGDDIPTSVQTAGHDAGLMIQWTIGSQPGEHLRSLRTVVGRQSAYLTATVAHENTTLGQSNELFLVLANSTENNVDGAGFTFTLPMGLRVLGDANHSCDADATILPANAGLQVSNASIDAGDTCMVSVAFEGANIGTYQFGPDNVTGIVSLENRLDTIGLQIANAPTPIPAPTAVCPSNIGWTSVENQVIRLYRAALGREPDAAGLMYWTEERLQGRLSDLQLAAEFLASSERAIRYGEVSTEEFVRVIYRDILGREGEADGVSYWTSQIDNGLSRAGAIYYLAESAENIRRTDTSPHIGDTSALICRLYQTTFGRSADAEGLAFWLQASNAGLRGDGLIRFFVTSPEADSLQGLSPEALVATLSRHAWGLEANGDERDRLITVAQEGGLAGLLSELTRTAQPQTAQP